MRHDWVLDEDGDIDTLAWYGDIHSGPVCAACDWSPCRHCLARAKVNIYETTCTGIAMVWPDDPFWGNAT